MVTSCAAIGCTYRHKKGDNIGLFRFPKDIGRRYLWIKAVRRANWQPTSSMRICGRHFQTGKPADDVTHPDWAPNKNMGYHKTISENGVQCKAHKPHLEESDVTFAAKADHLKTTAASSDDNHLKNIAIYSLSSPSSYESVTTDCWIMFQPIINLPPPNGGLIFNVNDAMSLVTLEKEITSTSSENCLENSPALEQSSDNEMNPAEKKVERKREEELGETSSHVVNDTIEKSHLNENLETSSDENLISQSSSEINISQAQTSIEINNGHSVTSNDAQNNSAEKVCKHSQETLGGSSASVYEKPMKIRKKDELFGKLVSIEISDLDDNSELYVKTKQAILNVLVQAHYEQMKFNDKISQFV